MVSFSREFYLMEDRRSKSSQYFLSCKRCSLLKFQSSIKYCNDSELQKQCSIFQIKFDNEMVKGILYFEMAKGKGRETEFLISKLSEDCM